MDSRRRYLIANAIQKKDGYVTNGLILHLDGIDYGGDPAKWIDLINGTEFTVNGNVSRNGNAFKFISGSIDSDAIYNIGHVEFVMTAREYWQQKTLLTTNSSARSIKIYRNFIQMPGRGSDGKVANCTLDVPFTLSGDYTNMYFNAVKKTLSGSVGNYITTYNGTKIGLEPNGGGAFIGDIYSVRFYNRSLTAEEIAQNFAVDAERFGIEV